MLIALLPHRREDHSTKSRGSVVSGKASGVWTCHGKDHLRFGITKLPLNPRRPSGSIM